MDPLPYTAAETKRMVRWVPVKDKKVVALYFLIPSTKDEYAQKPADFSRISSGTSKGSILEALKEGGLATGWGP